MTIPQVPEQNPNQSEIWLPRVLNPYASLWFSTQTVNDVPESIMGWLVAQGFEVAGIRQDTKTNPPTNYFTLTRDGFQPLQVLASLCNNYTIAANDARTANQGRYNEVVANWTQMIDSSHDQFNNQTDVQNAQAGVYLGDLDEYMSAIEDLIAENSSQMVADATVARAALDTIDTRLTQLETNAKDTANKVEVLLSGRQTDLQTFITDSIAKLLEMDQNFAAHLGGVLSDIASLDTITDAHIAEFAAQFASLAANYQSHKTVINELIDAVDSNTDNYIAEVNTILAQLDGQYQDAESELNGIKDEAGTLGDAHVTEYREILELLLQDFEAHRTLTRGLLVDLGDEERARINEEFAANLASQMQMLVSRGLFSSTIPIDVTARNHRDRDERIQALNDRLKREKLENEHRLYGQQAAMRGQTLDGLSRMHGVEQQILQYQASLISSVYGLVSEARNRILAGKQVVFAAKDAAIKLEIDLKSNLYAQIQDVTVRTADSLARIYQVQDVFAKWSNGERNRHYEQLQQIESQFLAMTERHLSAKSEVTRVEIGQRDTLLQQLQASLNGLLSGKERYASMVMQTASTLSDHRHRAIAERMNTAVQRLDGWRLVADQNRTLMAYQLDERNKLLVGLYSFVERREDTPPEWRDMAQMIAGLGDSGGGWLTPT